VKGPRRLFYMIVGTGDKLVAGEDVIAGRDKLGERIGLFLDCRPSDENKDGWHNGSDGDLDEKAPKHADYRNDRDTLHLHSSDRMPQNACRKVCASTEGAWTHQRSHGDSSG
jgi:hypothetical protein